MPLPVVFKGLLTTPEEIRATLLAANGDAGCAGVILWMHTFSPSRMWIGGLRALQKPILHLHTQFNREAPWDRIDMDFMNLNQAAHGDREAGFMHTRLRLRRKVVVGHWSDAEVQERIGAWARVTRAWHDLQGAKVARFGDNMRQVAVTEGDKVAAEIAFGFAVNGYGVGDLAAAVRDVSDRAVDALVRGVRERLHAGRAAARRTAPSERRCATARASSWACARSSTGGGFKAFTTTFEDLHGLVQLPGLAVQRLMADGFGFGAEGDWKTAALLRAMKVMGDGLDGGTSFMEDYTYHQQPRKHQVLGSHMLEICPTIAVGKPSLEVHPLGIGGKADPVRLVFDAPAGPRDQRVAGRPGRPLPPDRQRSGRREAAQAAQAARGPRRVGVPARLQDRLRRVDPRRRRAPHRLQLRGHDRAHRGLRRDRRRRARRSSTPRPRSAPSRPSCATTRSTTPSPAASTAEPGLRRERARGQPAAVRRN